MLINPEWAALDAGAQVPPDADPITLHGTVTLAKINEGGAFSGNHLTDDQNTFLDVGGAGGSCSATMSRLSLGDDDCPSGETCVVTGGSYRLHYTISRR